MTLYHINSAYHCDHTTRLVQHIIKCLFSIYYIVFSKTYYELGKVSVREMQHTFSWYVFRKCSSMGCSEPFW